MFGRKRCLVCGKKFFKKVLTYTVINVENKTQKDVYACIKCSKTFEGVEKIMATMAKNTVELENERKIL